MSGAFVCACGRQTREPFRIGQTLMCVVCAEDVRPDIVISRERHNLRRYGARKAFSPGFDRQSYDFGKHR